MNTPEFQEIFDRTKNLINEMETPSVIATAVANHIYADVEALKQWGETLRREQVRIEKIVGEYETWQSAQTKQ
jgi:hypothetical protein